MVKYVKIIMNHNILIILDSNNFNENKTFAIINCLKEKILDYSIVNINKL